MVSALSRVKTIKLFFWYHESVRNSVLAGVISSQTSIAFAGDVNFVIASVRNSGVSARREFTVLTVR